MASTYTDAGIELIGIGEQSNTWGLTTNTNWRLMEEMVTGVVQISLNGLTSFNLTTTDGVTSNGRHAIIEFTGAPGAAATVTVNPDDMQKLYFINNATDQIITITQGSGNSVTVPVGTKKIVYCDGAGGGAAVTDLTENLSLSGVVDVTTFKIDGVEITASASELNTLDGVTATTAELNVLDGITATTDNLNIAASHYVPSKGIILWSDPVSSIPSGWALCDGTNGTPDLSGDHVGSTFYIMKL